MSARLSDEELDEISRLSMLCARGPVGSGWCFVDLDKKITPEVVASMVTELKELRAKAGTCLHCTCGCTDCNGCGQ